MSTLSKKSYRTSNRTSRTNSSSGISDSSIFNISNNVSNISNVSNVSRTTKKLKSIDKLTLKNKPKTIKQYCDYYKKGITGKLNKQLYKSCKVNQYCRKYKCKKIDSKFKTAKRKILGENANTLLMTSLYTKCPPEMEDKNRNRCYKSAIAKFYKDTKLGEMYDKVIKCDKQTCAREKQIFNTNLFRIKQKQEKKQQKHQQKNQQHHQQKNQEKIPEIII